MQKTINELLKSRFYDYTKQPPKDSVLLEIDNNIILSRGNFILLSGAPKVGKSLVVSIILASFLNESRFFGIKGKRYADKDRMCIFDTEQGTHDLYKSTNRIFELVQIVQNLTIKQVYFYLKSKLDVFSFREDEPLQILQMIENFLQYNSTTGLIVIDSLLDLVYNYNDEKECKILINFLKRITKQYNIGVICILHTGKTTGTTIGHIGSFADRYCQSNLEVIKDKENVIIKAKLLRSAADFEPIILSRTNNKIIQID